MTVGAALRGRPCAEFKTGVATEGHPYNDSFTLQVFAGMPTTM